MPKNKSKNSPPPEDRLFCPEPTYEFQIGEKVRVGALRDPIIAEVTDDKKYYRVDAIRRKGDPVSNWFPWHGIRKLPKLIEDKGSNFATDTKYRLAFYNQTLDSLIAKVLFFGVDFNPPYQRGFVWSKEDKLNLIDSIFHNIDIGKLVFVHMPWKNVETPTYQILDGKQRLSTIIEYYLDKFPYKGYYYSELSTRDQNEFGNLMVAVCEMPETTTKDEILKQFIRLNTTGHVMETEHLNQVKKLLKKENK